MKVVQLSFLFLLGLFALGAESTIHPDDASSLSSFYASLSVKGQLKWATEKDLCSTDNAGVVNFVPTVVCDSQNPQRVVALYLNSLQLGGSLPSFSALPYLQTLFLHGNSFTGSLQDFSSFTALQVLDVSSNGLSGGVPSTLGALKSLQSLDLSVNGFTGVLPSELGGLGALQALSIGGNSLASSIPTQFGQLSSLTAFYASGAGLKNAIPSQIFSLPLQQLVLSKNSLSGGIPTFVGKATALDTLDLNGNPLGGIIPIQIGALTKLTFLDISSCGLTSVIPTQVGTLSNLDTFIASSNGLSGQIPSQIANSPFLADLRLDSNSFSGTIPAALSSRSLARLNLYGGSNAFCPLPNYGTWAGQNDYPGDQNCNSCSPTPCVNGGICTFVGNTYGCSCPVPYYNSTCQNVYVCPFNARNNANFTETLGGTVATGICTVGYVGSPTRSCGPTGVWSPTVNNICVKACHPKTANNANFPQTIVNQTATGTCLPGYVGSISLLCLSTGFWDATPTGSCNLLRCAVDNTGTGNANWAVTNPGVTATGTCLAAFAPASAGSPTRLCQTDGNWTAVTNPCVPKCPVDNTGTGNANWAITNPGATATGTCLAAFAPASAGSPTRLCQNNGNWAAVTNPCVPKCPVDNTGTGNANWAITNPGTTASGTCVAGFVGSPTRVCQADGSWTGVTNPCYKQCPADTTGTGNATWVVTNPGVTASGTCLAGYIGSSSRVCQGDGTWAAVTSSCYKQCAGETAFNATWVDTVAGNVVAGTCGLGFAGSPTRLCKTDGTWANALTAGSCTPVRCPVDFNYAHTDFPAGGDPGQWVVGVCAHGYSGTGTRFCAANGVWSPNFSTRCTANKCQPIIENFVSWPLTMFDLIVNRDCPVGYGGRASRVCGADGNWGAITNPCYKL